MSLSRLYFLFVCLFLNYKVLSPERICGAGPHKRSYTQVYFAYRFLNLVSYPEDDCKDLADLPTSAASWG